MNEDGLFRRRHLPHIDVDGKPYFVTGCLKGSISASGLSGLRRFREELGQRQKPDSLTSSEWEIRKHKLVFQRMDHLLDGECPARHLEDDQLAEIVQNAFLHFANQRYKLLAFVVMPSHHHWLFLPDSNWTEQFIRDQNGKSKSITPRESISHSIQSYTASQCNRILGRTGAFWQGETFDHFARDDEEAMRIIHYIENNPVKAGLVDNQVSWRWSSAHLRARLGIALGDPIPSPVG